LKVNNLFCLGDELQAYKRYLEQELANVTQLLGDPDKKAKRYIPLPVSSSLPDYVSSDFVLARINGSSAKSAENTTRIDESESSADGKKQPAAESEKDADQETKKDDRKSAEEEEKFTDTGTKASDKELAIVREENSTEEESNNEKPKNKLFGVQTTHLSDTQAPDTEEPRRRSSFEPTVILIQSDYFSMSYF
jgi:hypothetical protein